MRGYAHHFIFLNIERENRGLTGGRTRTVETLRFAHAYFDRHDSRPPHAYPNRAYRSHTESLRSLERSPNPYSEIRTAGKGGEPSRRLSTCERMMLSAA